MTSVVDRFMAFDRSLTSQETMAEFVACYGLSTWFLDAFDVIGFLWPNGGYGSGKTKLGILVCEMAYLGEVLLTGSSYATLRDLADMGATLLFDDAESLADPKKSDPDKRNLLLAGNRRGSYVTVKEAGPGNTWVTRYVNAYCPRLFTATRVPDPILASRTIVVPLVRTGDKTKANAEVLDYATWPCDQRRLVDNLWAVALSNLSEMPQHEAYVNADAPLVGRNLEPWRPVLAVAHWLEANGVTGLYNRMVDLAKAYQTERVQLEFVDHARIVVRALIAAAVAPFDRWGVPVEVGILDIVTRANALAVEEEVADEKDEPFTNPKWVGRVLTSLRLPQASRSSGQGRRRLVSLATLEGIATAYGIDFPLRPAFQGDPAEETEQTVETEQTEHRSCAACAAALEPDDGELCAQCEPKVEEDADVVPF
jgi:hypothetical protein